MIYELRIYYILPGRLDAIHKRFSSVTLKLFEKHNIRVVDFYEDMEGNDKLYYILEYDSMDARNTNFENFINDPEWVKAKELSHADGLIVEKVENFFMTRTPYSPVSNG